MNKKPFAIVVIILIVSIIGVFSIGSMVSAGEPPHLTRTFVNGDVETLIMISGNDIVVTIMGGNDTDKISSVYVYNNGHRVPRNSDNTFNNVTVGKQIVFKNMAEGLTGDNAIIVEAVFDDDYKSTKIIGTLYSSVE